MTATGPLSGVKVIDLCSYLAGPYGCTLLGDLGAEVVKVEAPAGDMLRHFPSTLEGESRAFVGINRNKRAITLDLKQADALAVLYRMVESSDVLVENFRPSVPARLGIDYDRLKRLNPRLVYCSLTGFGDGGPLRDKAGFDQVLQCMTGIALFQGGSREAPQVVGGSIVDYYTAALLAYGVTAALLQREKTGVGQYLAVSLLRSALTMQAGRFVWADREERSANRELRTGGLTGIHPTKDGALYISAHSQHFWQALCELCGMADLAADPRYDTMTKRAEQAGELVPRLRAALATKSARDWEEVFGERVPSMAIRGIEDMFDHPQVLAEGLVTHLPHPTLGGYRTMTKPVALADTPGPEPFAAPLQDQHSSEILAELGYTAEEIARLRDAGALG
jgi:formyl-CoA transferase